MKKFQVRAAGPIRLTSTVTAAYGVAAKASSLPIVVGCG
jgi:hypothetical protein